jgi:thiol reductant ABC exporter CydC subunit
VAVVAGVGAVCAAALISPPSAIPLAAALAVGAIVVPALGTLAARRAASREAPAQAELAAELVEALRLAPELAAFGAADMAAARIAATDRVLSAHRRRTALTIAAAEGCMTALAGLATVAVLLVAIPAVRAGVMSGVLLGALALLALASFEAVRPLPAAAAELSRTRAAAARVLELTDREPPVRDPETPAERTTPGRLELRGVAARYGEHQPWVLDGVDLALSPGEVVALVGESGTGKSTLAHLAVRFRDPDRGAVLLDGCDLRRLDQDSVRSDVVLAGQEAHLFATSIRENLRIGRPAADDDELHEALVRAHVDDFVAGLPDGLDTMVGEDGAHVSGGQRQRLALARALLASPRFLILDEPDAHLDDEVADVLVPELVEAAREAGVGVLVITHRRSAAGAADRVVELAGGHLAAPG